MKTENIPNLINQEFYSYVYPTEIRYICSPKDIDKNVNSSTIFNIKTLPQSPSRLNSKVTTYPHTGISYKQ